MTSRWDAFSDEELERIASGRATRYEIEQDRRYSQLQGAGGEFGSFLSAAGDSLSLGFGDELMGLGAGARAAFSGGDFGQAYGEQVERSRQRLRDAWRFHGGSALAGAVAGSLPLGGGLGLAARGTRAGAAALRNLGPMQRIGAAMGSGAAVGGVYGAGSTDGDIGRRALGAATGAGLGAATGGALQGVGMAGAHAWRSMLKPGFVPEERAAQELGKALNRAGITTPEQFGVRARELQRMERFSPGSNPMVMDALDEAGSGLTMAAGTRQSKGRTAMQQALEARNQGARERVDAMLVRDLGGGKRNTVADTWEALDEVQRNEAAPLYEQAFRQTVQAVPAELRAFVTFNSRSGARFKAAVDQARESMRRMTGNPELPDEVMFRSPRFWHQLQENVSAEVGAVYRSAKTNPLQGPRGTAVGEMVADDQKVNALVRRVLGPEYQQAMTKYAGAERLRRAWEIGYDAVRLDGGEMALAGFAKQVSRMTPGEREAVRQAAISGLRRELARADTGTGRSDVLRAIVGNEAKRANLRAIFGGEARLERVMRALDYERRLFLNYADTNLGRGSPTGDKLLGNQQMFAPNEIGGLTGMARRAIGRESRELYDEQMANAVLNLMRTPLTGPNAPGNVISYARRQGLLSRALREAERRRTFRANAGPQALQAGAINALGLSPNEPLAY